MDTDFISSQFSLNSLGHHVLDITQGHIYMWLTDADEGFSRTVSRDHLSIAPLCGSVAQLCPTLFNPMDCSTPGLPVLHYHPEPAQTHVHWISGTIQPFHPLSSPSPPALNLSQHQGLFPMSRLLTSGGQSIGASASASVFPMNIQDWFPLAWTGLISFLSKGLSRVFSSTTARNHQFFGFRPFLWSNSHIRTWLLEKS